MTSSAQLLVEAICAKVLSTASSAEFRLALLVSEERWRTISEISATICGARTIDGSSNSSKAIHRRPPAARAGARSYEPGVESRAFLTTDLAKCSQLVKDSGAKLD